MHIKKLHLSTKPFSKTPSKPKKAHQENWRNQLKQAQLVSQISSTLLQKQNWAKTLHPLSLSSLLSPPLLHRILFSTQSHPQISLSFFNFAKSNLGLKPELKTLVLLIRVLTGSGLAYKSKPILDLLIQTYPPDQIVNSAIQLCKGTIFCSSVLGSVLEHYCKNGSFLQALEVYKKGIDNGFVFSVGGCNSLLGSLGSKNETKLAWCLYGNMLRNEVLPDRCTWNVLVRILCKDGKSETIVRILDMGIYGSLIYNLVIDFYSKRGDFRDAFGRLDEMHSRKLDSGFGTYSSILDGACKFGNDEVIRTVIRSMQDKGLFPKFPVTNYDLIIRKLSKLGRTNAIRMLFDRACEEKVELNECSYGYMLMSYSKGGEVREAIRIYREIIDRAIVVNDSCYIEFVNALCDEDPSKEISGLLKHLITRGINPCVLNLSHFVAKQCSKGLWREAEELMNTMLDKDIVPSSSSCSLLVLHYCNRRDIDYAIDLHNKVKNVNGALDVKTYNVLIDGILKAKRVEEVNRVFDYMRTRQVINGVAQNLEVVRWIDTVTFTLLIPSMKMLPGTRLYFPIRIHMLLRAWIGFVVGAFVTVVGIMLDFVTLVMW